MHFISAQSTSGDVTGGMADIAAQIEHQGLGTPDFVSLHFGVGLEAATLYEMAKSVLGARALHGGSSSLGVMGAAGVDISGAGLGAFAIWDKDGNYGTSSADLGDDAEAAAHDAVVAALAKAGRPGEIPELVWLTVAPGREEEVIAGLRSVVGDEVAIVGGSSADNDVSGQWVQFGPDAIHSDGVVVTVLFPSTPVTSVYQSGYAPTGANGVVTRVEGRRLFEIDHRPADEVLHDWSGGAVSGADGAARSILGEATLWPLGRVTREVAGIPFHLLAHPAVAHPGGAVDLFASVAEGDRIWQMKGSADSLVARAGRVAAQARRNAGDSVSAALVVYCGGCMFAVRDRMDEVSEGIRRELGDIPWLGIFSFGEQGVPTGDVSKHGNLMISCTVFNRKDVW
jgi:hypothetical protein